MKNQKVAIGIDSQTTHHVVAMEKEAEQHILTKCSKRNTFQVTSDLLNSDNLKIAISQLCNKLKVCNFTVLELT